MERWDPDSAVSLMLAERCTHMAGATPFLDGLLARRGAGGHPAAGPEGVHLRRRVGAAVADPQGGRLFREGRGVAGVRIDRGAGDDGGFSARRRPCGRHRRPRGHRRHQARRWRDLRTRPADARRLSAPEDETASFDDEGYFRTGDLARWVDGGYLVVTGRAKDIIIRNGENISPKEVEDLLIGHPAIAEIAVVGVPDERTGERACAVIVTAGSTRTRPRRPARAADRRGAGQVQNP